MSRESSFVQMEGTLSKIGGSRKSWNKRHFRLYVSKTGSTLSYFKNASAKEPLGEVPLDGAWALVFPERAYGRKGRCFGLVTPVNERKLGKNSHRVFALEAESGQLRDDWLRVLQGYTPVVMNYHTCVSYVHPQSRGQVLHGALAEVADVVEYNSLPGVSGGEGKEGEDVESNDGERHKKTYVLCEDNLNVWRSQKLKDLLLCIPIQGIVAMESLSMEAGNAKAKASYGMRITYSTGDARNWQRSQTQWAEQGIKALKDSRTTTRTIDIYTKFDTQRVKLMFHISKKLEAERMAVAWAVGCIPAMLQQCEAPTRTKSMGRGRTSSWWTNGNGQLLQAYDQEDERIRSLTQTCSTLRLLTEAVASAFDEQDEADGDGDGGGGEAKATDHSEAQKDNDEDIAENSAASSDGGDAPSGGTAGTSPQQQEELASESEDEASADSSDTPDTWEDTSSSSDSDTAVDQEGATESSRAVVRRTSRLLAMQQQRASVIRSNSAVIVDAGPSGLPRSAVQDVHSEEDSLRIREGILDLMRLPAIGGDRDKLCEYVRNLSLIVKKPEVEATVPMGSGEAASDVESPPPPPPEEEENEGKVPMTPSVGEQEEADDYGEDDIVESTAATHMGSPVIQVNEDASQKNKKKGFFGKMRKKFGKLVKGGVKTKKKKLGGRKMTSASAAVWSASSKADLKRLQAEGSRHLDASLMNSAHHIHIHLLEGVDFPAADTSGLSDPYAKIYFRDLDGFQLGVEFKTLCRRQTLNPVWNQVLTLAFFSYEVELVMDFYDRDKYSKDDFLGRICIPMGIFARRSKRKAGVPLTLTDGCLKNAYSPVSQAITWRQGGITYHGESQPSAQSSGSKGASAHKTAGRAGASGTGDKDRRVTRKSPRLGPTHQRSKSSLPKSAFSLGNVSSAMLRDSGAKSAVGSDNEAAPPPPPPSPPTTQPSGSQVAPAAKLRRFRRAHRKSILEISSGSLFAAAEAGEQLGFSAANLPVGHADHREWGGGQADLLPDRAVQWAEQVSVFKMKFAGSQGSHFTESGKPRVQEFASLSGWFPLTGQKREEDTTCQGQVYLTLAVDENYEEDTAGGGTESDHNAGMVKLDGGKDEDEKGAVSASSRRMSVLMTGRDMHSRGSRLGVQVPICVWLCTWNVGNEPPPSSLDRLVEVGRCVFPPAAHTVVSVEDDGDSSGAPVDTADKASFLRSKLRRRRVSVSLSHSRESKDGSGDESKAPARTVRTAGFGVSTLTPRHQLPETRDPTGYDVYVVGVQECEYKLNGAKGDSSMKSAKQDWLHRLTRAMGSAYTLIKYQSLWEIRLAIFVRNRLAPWVSNVTAHTVPTGLGNVLGNKGGVVVSLTLFNTRICFTCAHLAAHQDQTVARNANMRRIVRSVALGPKQTSDIVSWPNYSFFIGDLNYRLGFEQGQERTPHPATFEKMVDMIRMGKCHELYKTDQLVNQMRLGNAFFGWHEAPAFLFRPTFKVARHQRYLTYLSQRSPAWCDRILTRHIAPISSLQCLYYRSAEHIRTSDHKPVCGLYSLQAQQWAPCIDFSRSNAFIKIDFLNLTGLRHRKENEEDVDEDEMMLELVGEDPDDSEATAKQKANMRKRLEKKRKKKAKQNKKKQVLEDPQVRLWCEAIEGEFLETPLVKKTQSPRWISLPEHPLRYNNPARLQQMFATLVVSSHGVILGRCQIPLSDEVMDPLEVGGNGVEGASQGSDSGSKRSENLMVLKFHKPLDFGGKQAGTAEGVLRIRWKMA